MGHVLGIDLPKLADRFWAKVDKAGPIPIKRPELGPCWLWTAYCDNGGYGRFSVGGRKGRMHNAHIVSWWLATGRAVPDGLQLDHLCSVRHCINPAHLEPVTPAENSRRSSAGAVNAARMRAITHCPGKHPYNAINTRYTRNGARRCKVCDRIQARARYHRDPEQARNRSRDYRAQKAAA